MRDCYFAPGEMAERSNAAVLKTVDCYRSGGSNPSLSAKRFLDSENKASKDAKKYLKRLKTCKFWSLQVFLFYPASPKFSKTLKIVVAISWQLLKSKKTATKCTITF